MATIRVFVPTHRRARMLERALASLRAQTFRDWVCEVHNDAPDDDAPARLVARLGDARITHRPHARNLGPTATFNLIFQATPEPFYSMLEDDNWWDPDFLSSMLAAVEGHAGVAVAWANMRVWQEEPDGSFRDTGALVHPFTAGEPPRLVPWGQPAQIHGAKHSNSAMLIRSRPHESFTTPDVPIAVVEMFRERLFAHPLLFVPRPLAHFSRTLQTARSRSPGEWATLETMLVATFLKHARLDQVRLGEVWAEARAARPPRTTALLLASLVEPSCRPLRAWARPHDWLRLGRGVVRRPLLLWRVLGSRRRHPDWWEFLDRATAARFAEQRGQP